MRGGDGEETVEHRVDAFRIAVEECEACEIVHEAETRHVGTHAAFEHRVIIGAKFHFHGVEFLGADSLLLNIFNNGIESGDSGVTGVFGTMKDARDHLRGAIGIEGVVAAVGFERDLLFEHELAVDAESALGEALSAWLGEPFADAALRHNIVEAVVKIDERPVADLMGLLGKVNPKAVYPAFHPGIQ